MSINWEQFREFLRHLGVEWSSEGQESPRVSAEPFITVLQRSREHEALYRVDWLATGPELLVLLPTNETALRFHFYRVTLSETYPLAQTLSKLLMYQGSEGFEQRRETAEWHLLYATVELMKALFWVGQEASQFPCEILVQKIG